MLHVRATPTYRVYQLYDTVTKHSKGEG